MSAISRVDRLCDFFSHTLLDSSYSTSTLLPHLHAFASYLHNRFYTEGGDEMLITAIYKL